MNWLFGPILEVFRVEPSLKNSEKIFLKEVDRRYQREYVGDMDTSTSIKSTGSSSPIPTNPSEFVSFGRTFTNQLGQLVSYIKSNSSGSNNPVSGIDVNQIQSSLERFWSYCESNPQIVQQYLQQSGNSSTISASGAGSSTSNTGGSIAR